MLKIFSKNNKADSKGRSLKFYSRIKEKGFTIMETLVAVFILVISITGPMAFSQSGLRASFVARDQITAYYLAQDVIETIKNIRDQNGLSGIESGTEVDWLNGLGACELNDGCTIDTTRNPVVITACTGDCDVLEAQYSGDNITKYGYNITGGEDSKFRRTVYITEINAYEAEIVVEITFTSSIALGERRVIVQENIYDWISDINSTSGGETTSNPAP